jgi:hypothetical protein
MHKTQLEQLDTASEALMALRWAIDRCLDGGDFDPFVSIVRAMMPAARAALESVAESAAGSHLCAALDALGHIECLVDLNLPEADFDRLIAIGDASLERAEAAVCAAQDLLTMRGVSRATRKTMVSVVRTA